MKCRSLILIVFLLIFGGLSGCGDRPDSSEQVNEPDVSGGEVNVIAEKLDFERGECAFLRWGAVGRFGVFQLGYSGEQ